MSGARIDSPNDVAIVAMEARVPGACTLEEFWSNVRLGIESVQFMGAEPPVVRDGVAHVRAAPLLEGIELFDASFFGFTPREAEVMDPQIRLFLESVGTALERAGCDPQRFQGRIGVFAGSANSTYLLNHLMPQIEALRAEGGAGLAAYGVYNDRDALATLAAYKLDLTGPAVTVQTFCSTSLVAVHLACQSLLSGESDLALAGGSSINVTLKHGYLHQEGGILSPDGHTRTFDAAAGGTVFGNGVALVVLKRLEDARRDGNTIRAVIRGSAVNNDGARKGGYTAPSVIGQAKAIAEAMAVAGVSPDAIGYVEAHGTATAIGDPIEIEALTRAFRTGTDRRSFCPIGSVKANIGHLDRAAGVVSLIKTVLMLENRELPPLVHYESPNPKIDFESSPFVVNRSLVPWPAPRDGGPRLAGVSSLGVGGTNAHVILEEGEATPPSGPSRPFQLLAVSARSESALGAASAAIAAHLRARPAELADTAFTLLEGRRRFEHRRIVVADSAQSAALGLEGQETRRVATGYGRATDRPVVFLFSGQGAQYPQMARGLYDNEGVFREALDACADRLRGPLGLDLRASLFPPTGEEAAAAERLRETRLTQPALFSVEYALTRLLASLGVVPLAMLGHSIGEYVAAVVSGVLTLDDALDLAAERGRLMQAMPEGAMLAVHLEAATVATRLPPDLEIAAVNAPSLCVVAGPRAAVDAFAKTLAAEGHAASPLHTSHAFHSSMMEPMLEEFGRRVAQVERRKPGIPYVSCLTGRFVTAEEVARRQYWVEHLRRTVRFAEGMETLLAEGDRVYLEVGPGNTLSTLARQQTSAGPALAAFPTLRSAREAEADVAFLLGAIGRLWVAGARVSTGALFAGERRRRLDLPTYPYERRRFWIDAPGEGGRAVAARAAGGRREPADWFYVPTWKSGLPQAPVGAGGNGDGPSGAWLVFVDEAGGAEILVRRLRQEGHVVFTVAPGSAFSGNSRDGYRLDPASLLDYERLLRALGEQGRTVSHIVHAWTAGMPSPEPETPEAVNDAHRLGFFSVLYLLQSLAGAKWSQRLRITALSRGLQQVLAGDESEPGKATLLGLLKVAPQEMHALSCASIDLDQWPADDRAVAVLLSEVRGAAAGSVVALRGGQRFVQGFEPLHLEEPPPRPARLRERGVYLITGGLGGVTFLLAAALAHTAKARLVLTGRARLPERSTWAEWRRSRGEADPVSVRIQRILALEQLGAEVVVANADVADEAEMRAAVALAEERFGPLDGVIHGAGVVTGSTFRPAQEIGPQECEGQFHAKVRGLLVLDRVLGPRPLDFCLLTSSLSSVLGGFAYSAYAAANVFMDAYARRKARSAPHWVSVNWDEWKLSEGAPDTSRRGLQRYAMNPFEGAGAFLRLLDVRAPQIVVSTGDLEARIDQWVRLRGLHEGEAKAGTKEPARHPRPQLQNAYVAPATPSEERIARIWAELLGIEKVGVQDNFFDLGGHSLLAIQVVTRLKAELKAEVSVATLFEGPTVQSLSLLISPEGAAAPDFEHSSDRGKRRLEERQRRQAERLEENA